MEIDFHLPQNFIHYGRIIFFYNKSLGTYNNLLYTCKIQTDQGPDMNPVNHPLINREALLHFIQEFHDFYYLQFRVSLSFSHHRKNEPLPWVIRKKGSPQATKFSRKKRTQKASV